MSVIQILGKFTIEKKQKKCNSKSKQG